MIFNGGTARIRTVLPLAKTTTFGSGPASRTVVRILSHQSTDVCSRDHGGLRAAVVSRVAEASPHIEELCGGTSYPSMVDQKPLGVRGRMWI